MTTLEWFLRLCTVLGMAVVGTALFFGLVSLAAWLQKTRNQGFPRTRRRRFL